MKSQPVSVSLLGQVTGTKPYLFDRINALLGKPGLSRFRANVAYARWDGVGLIAPNIEALLKGGGEFQTIYGVANGVTTPDSLLYGLYLQQLYSTHSYAGAIEDRYANATFHPKFFEFTFPDSTVAIIGSANLTGAGLSRNIEMDVEVECRRGHQFEKAIDAAWIAIRAESQRVTLGLIRKLKDDADLGSELQDNERRRNKSGKPRVTTGATVSPKPLFARVLDLPEPAKKARILAELDPLTRRPNVLYLQILAGETGGRFGGPLGYEILLPVATLGTFFGVGQTQKKQATFQFGDDPPFTVHLIHGENNTHRVRLRPLRDVRRPGIVIFRRTGDDQYACAVVPAADYRKVLAAKCTEQTRAGARRWGLE